MHIPEPDRSEVEVTKSVEDGHAGNGLDVKVALGLIPAMSAALAEGDAAAAALLVAEAERNSAALNGSANVVQRCRILIERARFLDASLEAMRSDLDEDHFAAAMGHFREALCLSGGLPLLKAHADAQISKQCGRLLPANWRVAEAMISDAAATAPFFVPNAELIESLRNARREEAVTGALHQADRAQFDGMRETARSRLTALLALYPDERRLAQRLSALDQMATAAKVEAERAVSLVLADSNTLMAKQPRPPRVVIPDSALAGARNLGGLVATTLMLAIAAVLVWQHFTVKSRPAVATMSLPARPSPPDAPRVEAPSPAETLRAEMEEKALEEESAWKMVKASDSAASIRSFLRTYPASTHVLRARVKLAAMEWEKVDKTDSRLLASYVQRHPFSPYRAQAERLILEATVVEKPMPVEAAAAGPRDRDAILETVRIYATPAAGDVQEEPLIEGDRATVRRQSKNGDNVSTLLFRLIKRDGTWTVQGVQ